MNKQYLGRAVVVLIAALLTINAMVIISNQQFSWTTMAQSYSTPVPPPPGIVQNGGNAIIDTNEDGSVTVVSLSLTRETAEALYISAEDIAALPDNPEEAIEIIGTRDGYVTIYKLPSNELQANIGPDAEGKIFVYVFDNDPLECITRYEFSTSDPTPRFYGPC